MNINKIIKCPAGTKCLQGKSINPLLILLGILVFAFITRVYRISMPSGYYFDEQYHVPAVKLLISNDDFKSGIGRQGIGFTSDVRFFEWWHGSIQDDPDCILDDAGNICINNYDWLHPPLAKYFQAISINVVNKLEGFTPEFMQISSIGWRMSSVVFGVMVIGATYGLGMSLFRSKRLSIIAAVIVALDGLILVQSRVAMNDIHLTFWILMAVWSYSEFRKVTKYPLSHLLVSSKVSFLEKNYPSGINKKTLLPLTGLMLGMAIATKWSGVFVLIAILIFDIKGVFIWAKESAYKRKTSVSYLFFAKLHWVVFSLVLIPFLVYLLAYLPMFMQGKNIRYFAELHKQVFAYQLYRDSNHEYQSHPLEWMTNARPVKYWSNNDVGNDSSIYAFGNPAIHLFGVFIVVWSCLFIWKTRSYKTRNKKLSMVVSLERNQLFFILMMYFSTWIPWVLSPRILFYYHYTPAVPLLSIIIAYWLSVLSRKSSSIKGNIYNGRTLVIIYLFIALVSFIVFYPHWVGLPVSKNLSTRVYFVLESWK